MSATDSALRGNPAMSTGRLLGQFRISAAMKPYVLRVRLHGSDFDFGSDPKAAVSFTNSVDEMRRILHKKRVPTAAADRAILKSLKAAVAFQLADLRYRAVKTMHGQSLDMLDRLIQSLRQLADAVAQLPPTSKGKLNKKVSLLLQQAQFDTEIFIEIIVSITATLPVLTPPRIVDQ